MSLLETFPIPDAMRPYASRVAVLPFESAGESEQDARLARGFREDIIVELARFPALGVITARSSGAGATAQPWSPAKEPPAAADYVVSGSVERSGGVIRVRARLVDARNGRQLWAERYDRPEHELFAIQDEITARVANALHARIDQQNLAAARRRPVTALAAYEAWLRGFELLQKGTITADEEARGLFQRALEIDPQFARGYAGISMSYFNEWSCSAWERWEETERLSFDFAQKAEALDPNDQVVQLILGRILQYRRRFDEAEHHFERALALAPNDAESMMQLAAYFAYQGRAALGVKLVERSMDLNPLCAQWQYPYAAITRFAARQYEETLAILPKAPVTLMVDLPAFYGGAAAYRNEAGRAGAMIEALDRQFADRISRGKRLDEEEVLFWLRHVNPFRREEDTEHLLEGVTRARQLARKTDGRARGAKADGKPRMFAWPIANTFRREGVLWTLSFDHRVVHLPELKGFRDLARLLERPNEEVHCAKLAQREETRGSHGGELLDERARRAYRERMRELRAEIAAAEEANDGTRAAAVREELDRLLAELGKATGLGGRARKMDDQTERARTAVAWRMRKAIATITKHHPALGKHLSNSVQMGVFCRYSPEKTVVWEV